MGHNSHELLSVIDIGQISHTGASFVISCSVTSLNPRRYLLSPNLHVTVQSLSWFENEL